MSTLKIFDQTLGLLQKVLDLRQQNQQLISANIANAETPGYVPSRLEFEQNLRQALSAAAPTPAGRSEAVSTALQNLSGTVVRQREVGQIGDNNGVQLDQEMIALSENALLYESAVAMMNKKLALLRYVANDGR